MTLEEQIQKLTSERDAALNACAEMRDVLGGCHNHGCFIKRPTGQATNGPCQCRRRAAEVLASTNCGKGYHHDDEWKPIIQALRRITDGREYNPNLHKGYVAGEISIGDLLVCNEALAHAERLTGKETK